MWYINRLFIAGSVFFIFQLSVGTGYCQSTWIESNPFYKLEGFNYELLQVTFYMIASLLSLTKIMGTLIKDLQ
jgi:hypothetical protein